jgi:hypothetical protein
MAEDFRGMAADRARGAQRARLIRFYTEQGYEPSQAAAMAAAEIERRSRFDLENRREPGFEGSGAGELAQMNRDYYRQNPGALSNERASDASMPGYDPSRSEVAPRMTYDPIMNRLEGAGSEIQLSRPMTEEDRIVARQTHPIPRGSSEGYQPRQPGIVDRAMNAIAAAREAPQATAPSAQAAETRDGRPAPVAPTQDGTGIPADYVGDAGFVIPSYTGDAVDAEALTQRYGARPSAPAAAPARQAPARQAAPMPPSRPSDMPRSSGEGSGKSWFSGMFKDPYEGKSSQDLFAMQQADPDNKGLYFRAAAKQAQERKDAGETVSQDGMKRGGAAGGHHKDAAIMKALEIIHHMLRRG